MELDFEQNDNKSVVVNTFPVGFILFTVFLVLKLTEVIAWSWWLVTMPLWIGFAIVFGIFLIGAVLIGVIALIQGLTNKTPKK